MSSRGCGQCRPSPAPTSQGESGKGHGHRSSRGRRQESEPSGLSQALDWTAQKAVCWCKEVPSSSDARAATTCHLAERRHPGGWRRKPGPAGVRGWPGQPRQRGCCFRCRPRSSGCRAGPALFPKAGKPTMRIHPKRAFPVRVGGRDCPWVTGPRYRTSPWGGWEGAHSERQCPGCLLES